MVAERDADVIVVGAGPAGSTAAYYLAQSGLDVLLLEKTSFPAGEGVRRRADPARRAQPDRHGHPDRRRTGSIRNKGLRVVGGGLTLELPWPELASWPDFGLVRPRLDFDETLVRHAEKAGARLHEQVTVIGPVLDRGRPGRGRRGPRTPDGRPATLHRAAGAGHRRGLRPAARSRSGHRQAGRPADGRRGPAFLRQPATDDDHLESWLELWAPEPGRQRS